MEKTGGGRREETVSAEAVGEECGGKHCCSRLAVDVPVSCVDTAMRHMPVHVRMASMDDRNLFMDWW